MQTELRRKLAVTRDETGEAHSVERYRCGTTRRDHAKVDTRAFLRTNERVSHTGSNPQRIGVFLAKNKGLAASSFGDDQEIEPVMFSSFADGNRCRECGVGRARIEG